MGEIFVGLLVSLIFIFAYGAQIRTLFKSEDVSGVSLWFWVFIATPVTFTLIHLFEVDAKWYVTMPQFFNSLLGLFILLYVSLFSKNPIKVSLFWIGMIILILSPKIFSIPYDIIQNVSTVMIIVAYISQIIKFRKLKTSAGTELLLYLLFALGMTILLTQMIVTNVPNTVIITETTNIILLITCAILNIQYRKK